MLGYDDFSNRVADLLDIQAERPINRYLGLYDELGFDSLQSFQLAVLIEGLAGLDIPSDNTPGIFTMDDAYRYYVDLSNDLEDAADDAE